MEKTFDRLQERILLAFIIVTRHEYHRRTLDKILGLLQWLCKLFHSFKSWLQPLTPADHWHQSQHLMRSSSWRRAAPRSVPFKRMCPSNLNGSETDDRVFKIHLKFFLTYLPAFLCRFLIFDCTPTCVGSLVSCETQSNVLQSLPRKD